MLDKLELQQIELKSEDIQVLEGIRESFTSLLNNYIDESPDEIVSGKCEYKCQNGWFQMSSGIVSSARTFIPEEVRRMNDGELQTSVNKAAKFFSAYGARSFATRREGELYLPTDQNIQNANKVIENIVKAINNLLAD